MERSNRYDWFKTKEQRKKDKKPFEKTDWKVFWKFTKIFLIFSLFFTSMYGCVQTLILKQDNFVGRGVELYLNEEQIQPHISVFKEHEFKTSLDEIYSLKVTNQNVWLGNVSRGEEYVKLVHQEINAQGAKLSDANDGVNEAVQIRDQNDLPIELITTVPVVGTTAKVPITLSTASKSIPSYNFANVNDRLKALDIKFLEEYNNIVVHRGWGGLDESSTGSANAPRTMFRNGLFEVLNKNNWMIDVLTLSGNYSLPANIKLDDNAKREKFIAISEAQKDALTILSYLGFKPSVDNLSSPIIRAPINDFMPGKAGEDYRPIVTWSQAWSRGVGPFYGLFVFPISKLQLAVLEAFPYLSGWEFLISMVIVIFLLRFLGFLLSVKSTMQQMRMQELSIKKAAIDAKYEPYKGNKQMMARQRQEVSEMYKKENISPFGMFSNLFVTMPLFLSIWRVIGSLPEFKTTEWLGINFSATSWRELFAGKFQYLPLMIFSVGLSILSQLYPKLLTKRRDKMRQDAHLKQVMKKSNRTQTIIMIVTAAISLIFSAGTQIYWIIGGVWAIIQAQITHAILKRRHQRLRTKRV